MALDGSGGPLTVAEIAQPEQRKAATRKAKRLTGSEARRALIEEFGSYAEGMAELERRGRVTLTGPHGFVELAAFRTEPHYG